ncbi:MAG TPA: hypothetical protein VIW03_11445 [Anaeromyxobacter sp.]
MNGLHAYRLLIRLTAGVSLALAALCPPSARAFPLLDAPLSLDPTLPRASPLLAAAPGPGRSLDFDLLGAPPPVAREDDAGMKLRRRMLSLHQGVGLGLAALELGTTVVGQLNYSDRFGSDPAATARYQRAHAALAYGTLGVFAVNGLIGLLAPRPKPRPAYGLDRVMVHRIGMAAAAAGMLTQGVLGVYTRQREGRLDQAQLARTHLAIGYATFAAFGIAVGALVF